MENQGVIADYEETDIPPNCTPSVKVAKKFTGAAKSANELTIYQHLLENLKQCIQVTT